MQKLLKLFNLEFLVKAGIAAILLAVPLYPKFPFLRVPGTYVSIRLEDFLIFIVVGVWGIYILPRINELFKNKIYLAIFLFLSVALLSLASGMFLTKTVSLHVAFLHWARRVEYLIVLFIAATTLKTYRDLAFYIKCLMVVILIVFITGVGQKHFTWPVITTQNDEYSKGVALRYSPPHLASTFAGHYDLAAFTILVVPLFMSLLFLNEKNLRIFNVEKTRNLRFMFLACIAMCFWLISNTASRISTAAFILSVVLVLVVIKKYKYVPVIMAVCFVVFISSGNLLGRYKNIFEVTLQKIMQKTKIMYVLPRDVYAAETPIPKPSPTLAPVPVFEDRSTSIRTNIEWPRAIRAFTKNPFLGTGFSSITLATDNDYLRLLGEVGLLGFASFMLILWRVFKLLLGNLKKRDFNLANMYIAGIFASFIGILINATFIDIFEASKFAILFWLMVGFAIAARNIKNETL